MTEGRDHWWHELATDDERRARPSRWTPRICSTCSTPRGTTAKPKGIAHTTAGYLVGVATTHHYIFDLKPRHRRLLVRRRRRLGHRPQLHRLRPALQRRHVGALRGHAGLPRQGPLVGDRRALRRDDPLHRADRDPLAHEVGAGARREARPLVAAAARLGRRADQPRGVDLVPRAHRRRALPDRRHVVADGDRDDHDHAAAGRHDDEARLGDAAVPRRRRGGLQRGRRRGRAGRRRLPRAAAAVAGDAARDLQGRRRATARRTGRSTTATSTSPATARASTRTATSGCSAASTT